ncbi:nuclear transport factor 2 family protein [Stella sp.]|uniref:nuclear transport factor 2 family protein n=1 Tax=Stella sp. TaxID=2912054 RepID=UPI0035AFBCD2
MIAAATAYGRFFETLAPAALERLDEVVVPEVRFVDPFNDVVGIDGMRRVLARMFADLPDARFAVTDVAVGAAAYLRWRFTGGRWAIEGVSEVHFAADGRASLHVDHWDAAAQLYQRVPVLGMAIRAVRRRVGVFPPAG